MYDTISQAGCPELFLEVADNQCLVLGPPDNSSFLSGVIRRVFCNGLRVKKIQTAVRTTCCGAWCRCGAWCCCGTLCRCGVWCRPGTGTCRARGLSVLCPIGARLDPSLSPAPPGVPQSSAEASVRWPASCVMRAGDAGT